MRDAFRKVARMCHPHKNSHKATATALFRMATAARDLLMGLIS
ncbi:MAG: J domain-containing protein [Puniceicoccales bacterium]|nr:J domain-containing protein [Puniceicoccales bacterium]